MSVQVSYKKQFLFGILFVIIALFVIEIISQFYLSMNNSCYLDLEKSKIYDGKSEKFLKQICNSYHSLLYYNTDQGLRFPIKYFEPNQEFENLSINDQGIRGELIPNKKSDEIFRIFVIGGSTTFGAYASSDETTIPGNLQTLMNELDSNKEIEVYNLGVFGRTSFEETYDLKNNFLQFEPDLIIVYDGWNDLYQNFNRFEEGKTTSFTTDFSKIFNILKRNYATLQVTFKIIDHLPIQKTDVILDSENMQIKADAWVENWNEICQIGKQENFDVVIFLQPILGTGNKPLSNWENYKLELQGHTSVVPYYNYLQEKIPILNSKCLAAFDISEIFNDVDEPVYYTMGHMNDFGNSIVADEIFRLTKQTLEHNLIKQNSEQDVKPTLIFLKSFGTLGNDAGEFNSPGGIAFFRDNLFVLDSGNNRVQQFTNDGVFLSQFSINGNNAQGIAISDEKIFVADTYNYKIKSYDYFGNLLNEFPVSWTRDIEVDENSIFVLEPHHGVINTYTYEGNFLNKFQAHNNVHYLNSFNEFLIASGPHPSIQTSPEVLIYNKNTNLLENTFLTSKNVHGSDIYKNHIFLLDSNKIKIFDFKGILLSEYTFEKNSENSLLTEIEIIDNFVYVLDTPGNKIHILKIIYE